MDPRGGGGGKVAIRTSRTTKAMPRETSLMKKEFEPKYSFFLIVLKLPMELFSSSNKESKRK